MIITEAKITDLDRIVEIYNWAILNTTATFDMHIKTSLEQQAWFEKVNLEGILLVGKVEENVMAWASVAPWSDRCAYSNTGEVSIYIDPNFHGQGHGKRLLSELIQRSIKQNYRTLLSRISCESQPSLALHKKVGFFEVGVLKRVGEKFNRLVDISMMQIMLDEIKGDSGEET